MSFLSVENQYRTAAVTAGPSKAAQTAAAETKPAESATEAKANDEQVKEREVRQDTFVKSAGQDSDEGKTASKAKGLSAEQLKSMQDQQMASFKAMLNSMIGNQARRASAAKGGAGLSADLFSKLTVSPEEQARAAQAISEDGEWGVNAVATRIMDMAVSLAGGDESKIDMLQKAVEKGFKAAGVEWGTSMPSITGQTHNEINKRFDYWRKNGSLDGYTYQPSGAEK